MHGFFRFARGASALGLALLLSGGVFISTSPAIDADTPRANPPLIAGLYCEAEQSPEGFRADKDCAQFAVVDGQVAGRDAPGAPPLEADLAPLSADLVLLQAVYPPGEAESRQYFVSILMMTPDGIAVLELGELEERDVAAAEEFGVSLATIPDLYLSNVADGPADGLRAWIASIAADRFAQALADDAALETLIDEARIAVRAGGPDETEPSATPEEARARYLATRDALRTAILTFEPIE